MVGRECDACHGNGDNAAPPLALVNFACHQVTQGHAHAYSADHPGAVANCLAALGYRVTVDPTRLQPEEWATVTLKRRKASPPSDLTLDVLMSPGDPTGMERNALRFPIPVTDSSATTTSTLAALVTAWAWTSNAPR